MAPIDKQAEEMATAALAPILAEYKRQQEEERKRAINAQATAKGGAEGLAQILGEAAPAIEGVYKRAGDSAFEYGRQLGMSFAAGSNEDAAGLNEFLGKQGSPQQVEGAGNAGGQVVAGLGGLIPASQMAREGAAFTAAARQLPETARLQGNTQAGLIGADSRSQIEKLDALLRGEMAKRPSLINDIRGQLTDDARADRSLDFQIKSETAAGRRADRELNLREKEAKKLSLQVFGSTETGFMSFDPRTGRVVQLTKPVPASAGGGNVEVVGSDAAGRWAYDEGTGEMTLLTPPVAEPKHTAKETREFKQDAHNMAYDAFWGIKDKDGKVTQKPMQYQQALAWLMNAGQLPLPIAQQALNRLWTRPGFAVDAEQRLDGKVYYFKPTEKGVTGRPLKPIQARKPQGEPVPVDPQAEGAANAYGGTTVTPTSRNGAIPGWNDKTIPSKIRNALAVAHAQVGKPYVWGAESPSEGGFDCSGLIEYAFEQAGIPTPGRLTTYSMMQLGKPVKGGAYKPGDWIITNGGKHVVMYVGKGQVIAAPRRGETVQYQPLSRFKGQIVAVRRFA